MGKREVFLKARGREFSQLRPGRNANLKEKFCAPLAAIRFISQAGP